VGVLLKKERSELKTKLTKVSVISGLTLVLAIGAIANDGVWFKAGPAYRSSTSIDVTGSSYVQDLGLTAARPFLRLPLADVGPLDAYADRTYDDGYVNIDDITIAGGAGLPGPGFTGFFGYNNASQYDGERLVFQRSGGLQLTRTSASGQNLSWDDDVDGVGAELAAGYRLMERDEFTVDGVVGLRIFANESARFNGSTYQESYRETRLAIRDTYPRPLLDPNDPNSTVFIPPAPFAGGFSDGNAGPMNIPDNREIVSTGSTVWTAANRIDMKVDSEFYDLRVGPQIGFELNEKVSVNVMPALSFNYLDVSIRRQEDFVITQANGGETVINSWLDRRDSGKFLMGASIQAGVNVKMNDRWSAEFNGSYDFVDTADFQVGPNRVKMDPSAFSVGLALVYALGEQPEVN
jgi:hypothetical protein